jgi:outer membrane biosynthesis protein TonB
MPAPQSLPSRLIGALFVERGLVSESQIRVALEIQRETGQQLGQVLVERFGVSRKELASVVADQWAKLGGSSGPEDSASWRRLGDIFVERGFVTQEELDEALVRQRQTGERLGEALVAQGVISKFELAGALAEQMAVLGDPDTEIAAENGQPEATVHQLHGRDDAEQAPPPSNVIDLTPPTDWGAAAVETNPQAVEPVEEPVAEEPPAESEAPEAVEAHAEPVEEPQPVEAHAEPEEEPEPVEAHAEPMEEPQPVEVMLTEFHEALAAEVGYLDETAPESDPRTACVAFAPTTDGYRLVALEAQPEPGETIDIPDVGEYLVLRVGFSPIPGDDRRCAYVEERVTPALVAAVAH